MTYQSSELSSIIKKYSPFVNEVRRRVFLMIFVFIAASVVGFSFYDKIIKFLVQALSLEGVNIVFTSPFQFINLAISCGLVVGIVAISPLLVGQVILFLKPALKIKEFKMIVRFLPFSIFLFLIGFVFGALIMKWQIDIFLDSTVTLGIGNVLDISKLLTTVLVTSVVMGVAFQFPVFLLILMRIGIMNSHQLGAKRMWIYLGSFMFALLLPIDSIIADVLLSLPLIILFETTLFLNYLFVKNK